MLRLAGLLVAGALIGASWPARAEAQWYLGAFVGANHNSPADVSLDQPAFHTAVVFHDVSFASAPFHFPIYAGARVGYLMPGRRFAVEFELLHLKVISETSLPARVTGTLNGAAIDETFPMAEIVQRYDMTHGLNFLLTNVVFRTPLGGAGLPHPVSVVIRAGAGPTVPGTDTVVGLVEVHQYEYAGFGGQAAAGLNVPIGGAWSATVEYKFTYAKPRISVAEGHGQTTARASQIAFGLALGFAR